MIFRLDIKMQIALRTIVAAALASQAFGFIVASPSISVGRQPPAFSMRAPQLRMSGQCEGGGFGRDLAAAATSAALIAGLFYPACVSAGNNYPPIDQKDPNRCEVGFAQCFQMLF
jgi:hypothetical protein